MEVKVETPWQKLFNLGTFCVKDEISLIDVKVP
jgi:hypothetical protein